MKLITQRDLIRAVADRWHKQYAPFPAEMPLFSVRQGIKAPRPKNIIHEELCALDLETATAKQVNDIIGNESWTRLTCGECRQGVEAIVNMGGGDYDCFYLCKSCVQKAYELIG